MRWYQVNSEELSVIGDVLLQAMKDLTASVESARIAGLPRQHSMQSEKLKEVQRALAVLPEIHKREE